MTFFFPFFPFFVFFPFFLSSFPNLLAVVDVAVAAGPGAVFGELRD